MLFGDGRSRRLVDIFYCMDDNNSNKKRKTTTDLEEEREEEEILSFEERVVMFLEEQSHVLTDVVNRLISLEARVRPPVRTAYDNCTYCWSRCTKGAFTGDSYCTNCCSIGIDETNKPLLLTKEAFERYDRERRAKDVCEHDLWLGISPRCEKCLLAERLKIRPKSP